MSFEAEKKNLEIALTGDSLITRHLSTYREPDFLALRDFLHQADVRFTNLEVVLGEAPDYPSEYCGGNWLGVPPYIADELSWLGFNLFSTANNHGGDFGTGGVLSTLRELAARRLTHAGAGENLTKARQPAYMDLSPGRVALIGVTSSIPHGHAAGEQRQDMIGRPGVNPLRHEITYHVRQDTMDGLKRVAEESGIAEAAAQRAKYRKEKPLSEDEYKFLEAKFKVSDTPGIHSAPSPKDLEDILKWVRDARRQAEFCFVSLHAHDSQVVNTKPAEFVEIFCRAAIDAGADGIFGHGPHILRGIEIYKGKPIFYSLGNFMMQSSTMQRVPAAMYQVYDLDPFASTLADIWDARLQKELIRQNRIYYESDLVRMSMKNGQLAGITLHPTHLGTESARPQQGRPLLAHGEMATKILGDLQQLSAPYGTRIKIEGEVGTVELG
ncbi:MAG: CapA family protein [Bacillota bacterium]|nr:CapA family protein [Bacillota bacterium]